MRHAFSAVLLALPAFAPAAAQDSAKAADAAAVATACGGEVSHEQFVQLPPAERVAKLSCFTREAAKRFNATLPKKVDEATMLESVSAQGTQLTYHYRVTFARTDLKPGALDAFKPTVTEKVCTAEDMRAIVAVGGSYRYEWLDKNGAAIGSLVVDRCPAS
jgi:hypothetical protein